MYTTLNDSLPLIHLHTRMVYDLTIYLIHTATKRRRKVGPKLVSLLCVAQHANLQLVCCANLTRQTFLRLRVDSFFQALTCTALGPNRRFIAVNLRFGRSSRNLKIVAESFCVQITEYAYTDTWEQLAMRNGGDFHRFRS